MKSTATFDVAGLARVRAGLAAALCAGALAWGCSALKPEPSARAPSYYALDASGGAPAPAQRAQRTTGLAVLVTAPQAAAGYDSQKMIYVRQAHKLEYFAHSEWVDPPARMLGPLIVSALDAGGAFRGVVSSPGSSSGDLRLDTEVLLLQQEFMSTPSQVRFALRAALVEEGTRRVVATRDFEVLQPAPSDNPYGGVQAANAAVRTALQRLAAFAAEAAAQWQPSRKGLPQGR
jgi:cholesterol transport system auxiliary component